MNETTQRNERFNASIVGKKENKIFAIDKDRCKGCRICATICPYDALAMSKDKTNRGFIYPIENGKCTACKQCLYACPDFVLSLHDLTVIVED